MGRTTYARNAIVAALAVILALAASSAPAEAAEPTFTPVKRYDVVRKLVFPVVGVTQYWSGFGACRDNCTREHHGIDIMTYGWKGLPVVAAHSGTITKVTYDEGNAGCSVRIRSRDRWETRYLHLNNDTPGTDEMGHPCPAPGIEVGTHVEAGQLIGWVGDSGNSEHTSPHIHFELRNRSGYPIDPYKSLKKSSKIVYEWLPTDMADASIMLSGANQPNGAPVTYVVEAGDARVLEMSEISSTVLQAPVIVVDQADPQPAYDEIDRLNSDVVVVLSNDEPKWLMDSLTEISPRLLTAPLRGDPDAPRLDDPNGLDAEVVEMNIEDRFATIIAGRVDRIWRSRQDEYREFIVDHRSLVLTDTSWANRYIGVKSWNSPGRHANDDQLWWITGEGWVGTYSISSEPEQGIAYVTERRATPWTLAYLGSVAEAPSMPVWKSE